MSESDGMIAGLQRAEAYPHRVQSVRVTETHISWVFLTGELAYKVKKPVQLGFLDFSTLELRRKYCEEELRLNRRYSPDLYLEVVPITGTPHAPHIGGDGEPFEYAVRMRQFPDDALFSCELKAGSVRPEDINALARTIAEFHSQAAIAVPTSPWGTPDAVWAPMAENFNQLRSVGIDGPEVRMLQEWSQSEFERRREVLESRRRDGFVRECHGDLHARNILLLDGRPRMFDCVEFNESFRWIDVLSDLAFLCMDLADFGRADFADRLLNAYLEATGDYAGLAAWRFYLVYRALVRAKVAAIRSQQTEDDAQRASAINEVTNYLTLAGRSCSPPPVKLFITHGPSGSGKSTLTQPLVEALGAIRIRSDIERRRNAVADRAGERYSASSRQQVYDRIEQLAERVLAAGLTVIVDATFLQRANRAQFRRLAERQGAEFLILDLQTPVDVLRDRVARRRAAGQDASEAGVDVLELQLKSAEPFDGDEVEHAIRIDTTRDAAGADLVALCARRREKPEVTERSEDL